MGEVGVRSATFGAGAASELHRVDNIGGFRVVTLEKAYNGLSSTFHLGNKGDFRSKFGTQQDPVRCLPQSSRYHSFLTLFFSAVHLLSKGWPWCEGDRSNHEDASNPQIDRIPLGLCVCAPHSLSSDPLHSSIAWHSFSRRLYGYLQRPHIHFMLKRPINRSPSYPRPRGIAIRYLSLFFPLSRYMGFLCLYFGVSFCLLCNFWNVYYIYSINEIVNFAKTKQVGDSGSFN